MISLGQVDNHLPGAQPCALGIFARDHIHLLCKRHLNPLDLGAATPKTPGLACKAVLGLGRLHSRSRILAPRGIVLLSPCLPAAGEGAALASSRAARSNRTLEGGGTDKAVGQARPPGAARS